MSYNQSPTVYSFYISKSFSKEDFERFIKPGIEKTMHSIKNRSGFRNYWTGDIVHGGSCDDFEVSLCLADLILIPAEGSTDNEEINAMSRFKNAVVVGVRFGDFQNKKTSEVAGATEFVEGGNFRRICGFMPFNKDKSGDIY